MLYLLATAAICLGGVSLGQDTGGPFTGSVDIQEDSSNQCVDNKGQVIPEGLLFTPGPDECQVCTCLRQSPVLCRTVLCAPPTGCRSLMAGDACCEWVCNTWETPGQDKPVSDLGLRLVASGVTAILSLSLLFFLIYRLRQRKLRGRQNHLEAESLNSVTGPTDDATPPEGFPEYGFPLSWLKPPSRPFPPSYNEAMSMELPAPSDSSSEHSAPPYSSIHQDPVISYPVSVMGRLVLPPVVRAPQDDDDDLQPETGEEPPAASHTTLPGAVRRHGRDVILHGEERDAALHRFSLQLNLNISSASSSSSGLTLSPGRTFTPTSQSSSDEEQDTQTRV